MRFAPLGASKVRRWCAFAAVSALVAGCEPEAVVGSWTCAEAPAPPDAGTTDAGTTDAGTSADLVVTVPWSTGFEDGFCGYAAVDGFCYANVSASYGLVQTPVRSGKFAVAFTVDSAVPDLQGLQARCVRQGTLPAAAEYSAWYLIPETHANGDNWNLFHFEGDDGVDGQHGLWDVSLVNDASDNLVLSMFDFLAGVALINSAAPPVPIGSWFHIRMFFRRAADATGEVIVYQDGVVAYRRSGVITDDTDRGEWWVGSLANALSPSQATLYVDDIAITESP